MRFFFSPLATGLCLLLAGCASISVTPRQAWASLEPRHQPPVIYVMDFDTQHGLFEVDRQGEELARFKQELRRELTSTLVKDISENVAPAEWIPYRRIRGPGLLVTGRFLRVSQGSRALRAFIGFGAGGTKLNTRVQVYNLNKSIEKPFLRFITTGGSNAEPGALTTAVGTGPADIGAGIAVGALLGTGRGVLDDLHRTSRMITATLSEYFVEQGWPLPAKPSRPKILSDPKN